MRRVLPTYLIEEVSSIDGLCLCLCCCVVPSASFSFELRSDSVARCRWQAYISAYALAFCAFAFFYASNITVSSAFCFTWYIKLRSAFNQKTTLDNYEEVIDEEHICLYWAIFAEWDHHGLLCRRSKMVGFHL